jgi:ABC-type phosphate transport system substrate-binding protein
MRCVGINAIVGDFGGVASKPGECGRGTGRALNYLDRKADFTRDLVARLGQGEPGALSERTGLLEATVSTLLAGDGELMSWEVVSACLGAAGVGGDGLREVRDRWAAAEQALWDERGSGLRAAFTRNGLGKPAKIVEAYQTEIPWRRLTVRHPVTFEPWAEPTFAIDRRLPDPAAAGDIRDLYGLLAKLKVWAGSPRQSEIEKRSWGMLPDATVSAMLQKDRWRAANDRERLRIGYFAVACGLPEGEVARWVEAYDALRHITPPDDLARARAEGAELQRRLTAAQDELERLRQALAKPATIPRTGLRRRWVWLAASTVLVLTLGVVTGRASVRGTPQAACFTGTLHVIGSTAFERTADVLRQGYESLCRKAHIEVSSTGSNEGIRALTAGNAASTIAMHDGHLRPDSDEVRLRGFQGYPIALIAYAVIVNKDTDVSDLSVQDLRSIYSEGHGPTDWKQLRGGGSVPIRLVSRTEGSGTRTIFEERVLKGPEPELSSGDCMRKDAIRAAARTIRCERSTQGQVLDMVNQVPGAIGYAELHLASDTRRYPGLRILTLDGLRAEVSPAAGQYPFIAPEVFYTYGFPANHSPVSAFLTFLTGTRARKLLQQTGSPQCITPSAPLAALCQAR